MAAPRILTFAASLRQGSFNQSLADYMSARLTAAGAEVTRLDLSEYPLPLYDGNLERRMGAPVTARRLHTLFRDHDAIFIASPEYNANLTPLLVNTLAWVSRVQDQGGMAAAFGRPHYALGSASPGAFGGYRGLMALRHSLELQLGARVIPTMVAVSHAHEAFDDSGELTSASAAQMCTQLVAQLLDAIAPKG